MSADEHRAAFGAKLGDRHVDQAVQRREHALDAAALLEVDLRKRRHAEDVAGGEHVRPAEIDDAVAVGGGGGRVIEHDALAVEEVAQLHVIAEERLGRQRLGRELRLHHPVDQLFVAENRGAFVGRVDLARPHCRR